MNKVLTAAFIFLYVNLAAQYCGNSGSSVCTPSGTLTEPWFHPLASNLPSMVNNSNQPVTLEFKNWNTYPYPLLGTITINSLKFDSISNLPAGTCWSTNKANNTFLNQEQGCVLISGVPCAAPGQYKLRILVTIYTSAGTFGPYVDIESIDGLKYFLRVKNSGSPDIAVDTNQTVPFVSAGYNSNCSSLAVSLGNNQTVCTGSTVTLSPTISGGTAPYSYSWSSSSNQLSCNSCASPTATSLQSATYSVTLTDGNGTTVSASVNYSLQSGSVQITPNGSTTVCFPQSVGLSVPSSFASYQWSNGNTSPNASAFQTGVYSVTVTTLDNCSLSASISINVNQPTISNYQITSNGPTSSCSLSSITLNAGSGFSNYNWSTGQTQQTITVNQSNSYMVTALGNDGCLYYDSIEVNFSAPFSGLNVCIVGVDPVSGKNLIVWEKPNPINVIDTFKIYKESSISGVYQLIKSQPAFNFSTYLDNASTPSQKSDRYVITTVGQCGESSYSPAHKTIHLVSNLGLNNVVNLQWNSYEGFSLGSYNIYRGSNSQNMQQIAQVNSSTLSYSDLTPPSPPIYYQIEAVNPAGCVPTQKNSSYSSSLSNIFEINASFVSSITNDLNFLYTYFDESLQSNIIKWTNSASEEYWVNVFDLTGRLVFSSDKTRSNQLTLPNNIVKSAYIIELKNNSVTSYKKLFLQ
jgi:hypothetical protein